MNIDTQDTEINPERLLLSHAFYGLTTALTLTSLLGEEQGIALPQKRDRTDASRRPGVCWNGTERANKPLFSGVRLIVMTL